MQWYIFVGALLVSVAAFGPLLAKSWLAPIHLQLLGGVIVGPWCLGLIEIDLLTHTKVLEVASEIAVIISLYAAGIKMRIPLSSGRWKAPVILATLTMVVTIALTAALGGYAFGFSLPAALLLGAVLAPTDPVLADKIQVQHAGDDDRLRQSLTGESGLNDGTAFPFVLLAVGLSDHRLHELGTGLSNWILVDLLWKTAGGLLLGAVTAYALGRAILWLRERKHEDGGAEELLTLGLIAIVYGIALSLNTYAFLAVFAAAVSLRRIEMLNSPDDKNLESFEDGEEDEDESTHATLLREQTAVGSALEHIAQVFLVVVIGVLLSNQRLFHWQLWLFAAVMICLVRPIAVMATLHTKSITARQRKLIAWFGVRGIGTLYYLTHATSLGVDKSLAEELPVIVDCCVVTITLSIALHGSSDTPLMRWYASQDRMHKQASG